jgi:signal transduction histidine kinase
LGREFNVPVTFSSAGTPVALTHPCVHDLLMVAREAVFNALVHGKPSKVDVSLTHANDGVILRVHDDGCGFEAAFGEEKQSHHFGLQGMRERIKRSGGQFSLQSKPGKGVLIEARMGRKRT